MIQPVKNNFNINFKGTPQRKPDDDGLQFEEINAIFRRRDAERALEQQRQAQLAQQRAAQKSASNIKSYRPKTQAQPKKVYARTANGDIIEYTPRPRSRAKKKKHVNPVATAIMGLTALLATFSIGSYSSNQNKAESAPIIPPAIVEEGTMPSLTEDEIIEAARIQAEYKLEQRQTEIAEAVNTIKSSPEMKKTYYDMIETLQRMEDVIDNPVGTINDILSESYAEGVEIEMVLPQIFFESSGFHYNEDGSVNSSYANCNGWTQIGVDAWGDMNKKYFFDNELDRDVPIDNLKLGIAYNHELMSVYFPDDLFNVFAAYNCGPGNARRGNYGEAADYSRNILNAYKILKDNPDYTQMLLNGELDEFQGEFRY